MLGEFASFLPTAFHHKLIYLSKSSFAFVSYEQEIDLNTTANLQTEGGPEGCFADGGWSSFRRSLVNECMKP
jgi:hypothetical protein